MVGNRDKEFRDVLQSAKPSQAIVDLVSFILDGPPPNAESYYGISLVALAVTRGFNSFYVENSAQGSSHFEQVFHYRVANYNYFAERLLETRIEIHSQSK